MGEDYIAAMWSRDDGTANKVWICLHQKTFQLALLLEYGHLMSKVNLASMLMGKPKTGEGMKTEDRLSHFTTTTGDS